MTRSTKPKTADHADPNRNVLVVDDQPHNRLLLHRVLTSRRYRVETAADGEQAWQKLMPRRFGFIVTDYEMPKLDGVGLVERIRRCPWDTMQRCPIILHSTNEDKRLRNMVRSDDRTFFFPKPMDVRTFDRILRMFARRCNGSLRSRKRWFTPIGLPLPPTQNLMPDI